MKKAFKIIDVADNNNNNSKDVKISNDELKNIYDSLSNKFITKHPSRALIKSEVEALAYKNLGKYMSIDEIKSQISQIMNNR